jgi:hypothetical protein
MLAVMNLVLDIVMCIVIVVIHSIFIIYNNILIYLSIYSKSPASDSGGATTALRLANACSNPDNSGADGARSALGFNALPALICANRSARPGAEPLRGIAVDGCAWSIISGGAAGGACATG